jgi:hypothetical protein
MHLMSDWHVQCQHSFAKFSQFVGGPTKNREFQRPVYVFKLVGSFLVRMFSIQYVKH